MKRIVLLLSFAFCLTSTKSQIKTTYSNQKIKIEHIASGTTINNF